MITLVIVALGVFDVVVERFEHYLHHEKRRFHQRLLKKVRYACMHACMNASMHACEGLKRFFFFLRYADSKQEDQIPANLRIVFRVFVVLSKRFPNTSCITCY